MAENHRALAQRVGRILASYRQERGVTQDKVAELLGVEPETISRFERGETLPSLVRLAELAEVYEVPLEALVRGVASSPLDQANEIAGELNRLSRDDRDFVRRWVTEMCARLREKTGKASRFVHKVSAK